MLKFILADRKIVFVTHNIMWTENEKNQMQDCYSAEEKDTLVDVLTTRDITPVVTELEQPSAELLNSCVGKIFSSYADAVAFVDGTYVEPLTVDDLVIIISDIIGGVYNV